MDDVRDEGLKGFFLALFWIEEEGEVGAEEELLGADEVNDGFDALDVIDQRICSQVVVDIFEGLLDFRLQFIKGQPAAKMGQDDGEVRKAPGDFIEFLDGGGVLAQEFSAYRVAAMDIDRQAVVLGAFQDLQEGPVQGIQAVGAGPEFSDAVKASLDIALDFLEGKFVKGRIDGHEGAEPAGIFLEGLMHEVVVVFAQFMVVPVPALDDDFFDAGFIHELEGFFSVGEFLDCGLAGVGQQLEVAVPLGVSGPVLCHVRGKDVGVDVDDFHRGSFVRSKNG